MTCIEAREAASAALLSGDAWPPDLRRHVDGCSGCASELDGLSDVVELLALGRTNVVPPPEAPDPALLDRLLAAAAQCRVHRRRQVALAVAAAVVLVIALGAGTVALVHHPANSPAVVALDHTGHDASTGVTGAVGLSAVAGGTQVAFSAVGVAPRTVCTLQVVTGDGVRHEVLTWTAGYASAARVTGTVDVPVTAIVRAELVDADGHLLVPVAVT